MSGFAHPYPQIRLHRSRLLIALAVIGAATALVLAFTLGGGDSARSGASVAPISATSGPNETARGNAASIAAGASDSVVTGGPDESARGVSAATASGASQQPVQIRLRKGFRGRSAVWQQP